ncbi:MAG: glycoside hydrolase [Candidatus Aminicenantales bacterium]
MEKRRVTILRYFFAFTCLGWAFLPSLNAEIRITVDRGAIRQTMHSFGASDAWRIQFIGKYWPLEEREAIADLLFGQSFDSEGNPKGIGLSLWRFNIGAGSAEQGEASGISNAWRRTECFLDKNGKYDWTRQAGERWFLEAARRRGVEYTLGFSNSAPWFFTNNGLTRSAGGRGMNLKDGHYGDFAAFLAEVGDHFQFDYLSPVNEPQWEWADSKQEGSPASNSECCRLIARVGEELQKRSSRARIVFGEAGSLEYLTSDEMKRADADDQIEELFSAKGQYSLSGIPSLRNVVSSHSYWTVWPVDQLISRRRELAEKMRQFAPGFEYWQSEYCVMEDNDDVKGGPGRDVTIDTALYVARIIHFDLTAAGASSWQWWTAVSDGDYKDGLIYIDPVDCRRDEMSEEEMTAFGRTNRRYEVSKLLWALGNYSRFVRPGMQRAEILRDDKATEEETATGIMISVFVDPRTEKTVLVAVNYSAKPERLRILKTGFKADKSALYKIYETSASADLSFRGMCNGAALMAPRSVITFVEE